MHYGVILLYNVLTLEFMDTIVFATPPPLSLDKLLHLNSINHLFLTIFEPLSEEDKIKKIHELINANQFDAIVKYACNAQSFKYICTLNEFSHIWVSLWSTYGVLINNDPQKVLYDQPTSSKFELFLGIYFYYKAYKSAKY